MSDEVQADTHEQQTQPEGFKIHINFEELRKKRLFITTPMYGGMCNGMFNRSMLDLASLFTAHGIPFNVHYLFNESLIPRARNYCVDEFMRSGATHMLFIDADIGFDPRDVLAMMAMQTDESPYDVIGAPYPKKTISWEKIKLAVDKGFADEDPQILNRFVGDYVFNPKGNKTQFSVLEPVEVLEIGTGFMMVRRRTFEVFADRFKKYLYRPDHIRTEQFDGKRKIMMYFQAEIDDVDYKQMYEDGLKRIRSMNISDPVQLNDEIDKLFKYVADEHEKKSLRYLSEDYWFCQKIQELGMSTWLCPWMKTVHVGSYHFDGSLIDLAAIGAPATADPSMLNKDKPKKKK